MYKPIIAYVLLILCQTCWFFNIGEMDKSCLYKQTSKNLDADVILGAVFPIQDFNKLRGKYVYQPNAITWVESFYYAIHKINNNSNVLPGIKLGYDIRNNCNEQEVALNQTLDFMIDQRFLKNTSGNIKPNEADMCLCKGNSTSKIAAVIGGYSSELSGIMSKLLSTDSIPQISYGAMSPTLGDKKIYESFLRTLPSDLYQTKAIADLLHHYKWTYVSLFASDDDYGRIALDKLRDEMKVKGMCLAVQRTFDPRFPGNDLNKTIEEIKKIKKVSNVIILWCHILPALNIIQAAYAAGIRNITWIGTETWGSDIKLTDKHNKLHNLSVIGLSLKEEIVTEFQNYVNDLSWESKFSNPWLEPMWEELWYCPRNKTKPPPFGFCIRATPSGMILPKYKHYHVITAVYAVAYGLHTYFECNKHSCAAKNKPINYKELLEHIKKARFTVNDRKTYFEFDENGDAAFSSYNVKVLTENSIGKKFLKIGRWDGETRKITALKYNTSWSNNATEAHATCSHPCKPGFYIIRSLVTCCWSCNKCPKQTISVNVDQEQCKECTEREVTNTQQTQCQLLPRKNLSIKNMEGQSILVVAAIGVISTIFVLIVFIKYWETPVIKSSSREMSAIQLSSIMLLFCLPVLHMVEPGTFVCVAQITCFGMLYAFIIAFIVLKTYRLLRVFNRQRFTELSKYLQSRYQVFFSFTIVFIELIAIMVWYSNPGIIPQVQVERQVVRTNHGLVAKSYIDYCGMKEDMILYGVIVYILLLSLVSGFMAFKARSLPENFNEAQFIWLAMFTTCLAWCLFFLLHLSLERNKKPIVLLCIVMVNNFCLLGLLYGYKIYIILFLPHLNTQAHFRKMATNATVTTFLREMHPGETTRPREQSVISFDFDSMFDEYKNRQKSNSIATPRKLTMKFRRPHLPSLRRNRSIPEKSKNNVCNKKKIGRNKTLQLTKEQTQVIRRSVSLNDNEMYRLSIGVSSDGITETSITNISDTLSDDFYDPNNKVSVQTDDKLNDGTVARTINVIHKDAMNEQTNDSSTSLIGSNQVHKSKSSERPSSFHKNKTLNIEDDKLTLNSTTGTETFL